MGKKQRASNHASMESNIIEFLMLSEADNITAKDIAVGIGLHNASDVTGRLNALHGKGIITKSRINKRVYWGVVQDNESDQADSPPTLADSENANSSSPPRSIYEQPITAESNESEPDLVDGLLLTIDTLQSEVKFLSKLTNSLLSGNCIVNSKGEFLSNCSISPKASARDGGASIDGNPTTFARDTPVIPEEGFTTPKRSAPPPPTRSWAPEPIATSNRFEVLACNDDDGVDGDSSDSHSSSSKAGADVSSTQDAKITRRPKRAPVKVDKEPCEWRHPLAGVTTEDLDETLTPVSEEVRRIVAEREGLAMREKAEMTKGEWKREVREPLVAVVGDSMIKRMSSYDIKKRTTTASTFVRPFSGAKIEEMLDYLQPVLRRGPDVIVLHVGTNDLNEGHFTSEEDVIERLDELIKYLQECGVIVIVSFVICRRDDYINLRVQKFNKLLFDYCAQNLIIFIDNNNIDFSKLYRDGLHLNAEGSNLLCDNISKCIDYVIPYCFGR